MQYTDLLMIDCGSPNLAVGVALEECSETHSISSSLILEKDTSVCWYRGMLFPEAQSQVSFLKDLVTQRDPTSRFVLFKKATSNLNPPSICCPMFMSIAVNISMSLFQSERKGRLHDDL